MCADVVARCPLARCLSFMSHRLDLSLSGFSTRGVSVCVQNEGASQFEVADETLVKATRKLLY